MSPEQRTHYAQLKLVQLIETKGKELSCLFCNFFFQKKKRYSNLTNVRYN